MAAGIFISYRRKDTPHAAGRLFERLEKVYSRDQLFIDVDSIEPGVNFVKRLPHVLCNCEIVLVLIGPNWLDARDETGRRKLDDPNDYVRQEIEHALSRDIHVIPVLMDGANLPKKDDVPPGLEGLLERQAVRISHEVFPADAERLVQFLTNIVNPHSRNESNLSPPSKSTLTLADFAVWFCAGVVVLSFLTLHVAGRLAAGPVVGALGVHLYRSNLLHSHRIAYSVLAIWGYLMFLSALGNLLDARNALLTSAVSILVVIVVGIRIRQWGGLTSSRPEMGLIAIVYVVLILPAVFVLDVLLETVLPGSVAFSLAWFLVSACGIYLRRQRGTSGSVRERVLYWLGSTAAIVLFLPFLFDTQKWSFLGPGRHSASGWLLGAVVFGAGLILMLADLRRYKVAPPRPNRLNEQPDRPEPSGQRLA